MPAYRVNIDGRAYQGHYGEPSAAVYGAMLIDDNLLYEQDYEEWLRIHRSGAAMLIGVEPVTDHFVAKKCHRVDAP
jgi:hypothetical protein